MFGDQPHHPNPSVGPQEDLCTRCIVIPFGLRCFEFNRTPLRGDSSLPGKIFPHPECTLLSFKSRVPRATKFGEITRL